MPDDWYRMTGEGKLPAHRDRHGSTQDKEQGGRPEELKSDHLVIGVPKVMHDPVLPVPVVTMMIFAVDLHGRPALVGK